MEEKTEVKEKAWGDCPLCGAELYFGKVRGGSTRKCTQCTWYDFDMLYENQ